MAKYIPFPIDLSKYKSVEELTPLKFGILMRFIDHYWKTGIELPKVEFQLYHIARCPFKQWARSRDKVYQAMKDSFPDIIKARNKETTIRLKFGETIRKSHALKRLAKSKTKTFSDENGDKKLIITAVPKTHEETAWNKGQFDPIMRKMALKNNEAGKDKEKWFTDK